MQSVLEALMRTEPGHLRQVEALELSMRSAIEEHEHEVRADLTTAALVRRVPLVPPGPMVPPVNLARLLPPAQSC